MVFYQQTGWKYNSKQIQNKASTKGQNLLSEKGEGLITGILLSAFIILCLSQFFRINLHLDQIEDQSFRKFHKNWKVLEKSYAKTR